ncbi:nuclear transport factor 2 family protein [Streptomyces sp. NPDC006422]|uniref:nuclear transport factor 2 family protein n=1 Tax=unclassified Streptomyces TaxID=2593676 RepID=UPI0033B43B1C
MLPHIHPPDPPTLAALHAVERRRQRALVDADLGALDEIFDDTLVYMHAHGITHTKAQLLAHTADRRPYLAVSRGELLVRLAGDVAVMTGPLTNRLRTPDGGTRTLAGVATQILHRGRGDAARWRFISFQMTPFADQK